jgi:hypothetical protein
VENEMKVGDRVLFYNHDNGKRTEGELVEIQRDGIHTWHVIKSDKGNLISSQGKNVSVMPTR